MKDDHRLNHRKRLREKYEKIGFENLTEHERLEMILYFIILRKDTKPMAHDYLKKYGSILNILNASPEQLKDAEVPDATRFLFKFLNDLFAHLRKEDASRKQHDYDSLGKYFVRTMKSLATETLGLVVLDSDNKVLRETVIDGGTPDKIALSKRKIVEICLAKDSSKVALAHNHPSGCLLPSFDDHSLTKKLDELFSSIGITLVEHFVIGKGGFKGIIGEKNRIAPKKKTNSKIKS